jgi:hypothetical protein
MAKQKALQNTAFHESGHAVVAFMLGVSFRSVTIRADAETESLGMVMLRDSPKWAIPDTEAYSDRCARAWFERTTQISLAGQISEAVRAGRRPARYSHSSDNDHAVDRAIEISASDEEASAWINWLFIRTRNMLGLPFVWAAVVALGRELMERETITGAAARMTIRNAMRPPGRLPKPRFRVTLRFVPFPELRSEMLKLVKP